MDVKYKRDFEKGKMLQMKAILFVLIGVTLFFALLLLWRNWHCIT